MKLYLSRRGLEMAGDRRRENFTMSATEGMGHSAIKFDSVDTVQSHDVSSIDLIK